ncbi:MAG: hypothetical protein LBC44_03820 [Mycoplasmataceae bacterium]|nr:hypothetical protein [Mycoplasmataceae bacterium]
MRYLVFIPVLAGGAFTLFHFKDQLHIFEGDRYGGFNLSNVGPHTSLTNKTLCFPTNTPKLDLWNNMDLEELKIYSAVPLNLGGKGEVDENRYIDLKVNKTSGYFDFLISFTEGKDDDIVFHEMGKGKDNPGEWKMDSYTINDDFEVSKVWYKGLDKDGLYLNYVFSWDFYKSIVIW